MPNQGTKRTLPPIPPSSGSQITPDAKKQKDGENITPISVLRKRSNSLDTTLKDDEDEKKFLKYSFDEYLQTTNNINTYDYLQNFFGKCSDTEKLLLDIYQNVQSIFYIKKNTDTNTNQPSFNTIPSLPPRRIKQISFMDKSTKILKNMFKRIEGTKHTFYVYRCYQEGVNINTVEKIFKEENNNVRFVSTSLSHRFAQEWCGYAESNCYDDKNIPYDLEICIKIPKGSKVLPLIKKVSRFEQYEILLPPGGRLIRTNECHRGDDKEYNIPVYRYEQSEEYINEKEETVIFTDSEEDALIRFDLRRIEYIEMLHSRRIQRISEKLENEKDSDKKSELEKELKKELENNTSKEEENNKKKKELKKRLDELPKEREEKLSELQNEMGKKETYLKDIKEKIENLNKLNKPPKTKTQLKNLQTEMEEKEMELKKLKERIDDIQGLINGFVIFPDKPSQKILTETLNKLDEKSKKLDRSSKGGNKKQKRKTKKRKTRK